MVVMAVMTTLCTAGVAFYVRFLVALWTEGKHAKICYLVRLQPDSGSETREVDTSIPRAA